MAFKAIAYGWSSGARRPSCFLGQIAFKTLAPALTAQVNCAYAYAAASHADAWLAEHFQKQNALKRSIGLIPPG
ncbi:MAG: hypothetical protein R6W92_11710, partial [Desulfocurvibacter africanus]